MPIRKVRGGYKVGRGSQTYRTRISAERAQRAIHAKRARGGR